MSLDLNRQQQEHASASTDRARLSACLIVQDEQERLPACLASIGFCDQVVVVDGGSRDRTVEQARAAGAKVIKHDWCGYAAQRNVALDHAENEWVLEIDADERITEPLRAEIIAFLEKPPPGIDMAMLPLRHFFLGRLLGPSGRYPAYRSRLFRRDSYRHDETRTVHEGLWTNGLTYAFTGDLEHRLADSWREALGDWWRYARLEASRLPARVSLSRYFVGIAVRPAVKVVWRTVVFAGWRDGWQGFVHIALDASHDSLVWLTLLARRVRRQADPSAQEDLAGSHFSQDHYKGPARLVAVAQDARSVERARVWLARAREQGADVALMAPMPVDIAKGAEEGPDALHTRHLGRLSLLNLVRATDAEMQLRSIDVLIGFGARSERLLSRVPGAVRGTAPTLHEGAVREPEIAIRQALASRPAS